jgi:hypothetical protein
MSCVKLRDLQVRIDGKNSVTVVSPFTHWSCKAKSYNYHKIQQLLLDIVARLPELKILRFFIIDPPLGWANFNLNPGLRYVEELEIEYIEVEKLIKIRYILEKDGEQSVGYRETMV